jgi:hypothetical protein
MKADCPCCNRCKVYVEGPLRGHCLYGGPFEGYFEEMTGTSRASIYKGHEQRKSDLPDQNQ